MGAANTKRVRKPRKGARNEDGEAAGEVKRSGAGDSTLNGENQQNRANLVANASKEIFDTSRISERVDIYENRLQDAKQLGFITQSELRKYKNKIKEINSEIFARKNAAVKIVSDNTADIIERSSATSGFASRGRESGRFEATQPMLRLRGRDQIIKYVKREIERELAFSKRRRGINVDVPSSIMPESARLK